MKAFGPDRLDVPSRSGLALHQVHGHPEGIRVNSSDSIAAYFFSAGCNIPLFVSGPNQVQTIMPPNDRFRWINYFDKDDLLVWPLGPLNTSYGQLVQNLDLRTRAC